MRSFLYSYLMDNLQMPETELFCTSERNITSYIRSSLEILKRFHRRLVYYQVDSEYNIMNLGRSLEKTKKSKNPKISPDIIIHKRGKAKKDAKNSNYLCMEIKKIKGFNGDINKIRSKSQKKRLTNAVEKLKFLRKEKTYMYEYGVTAVVSEPHTIFLKINDDDFKRCMIKHISSSQKKRFIDIINRVIFLTLKQDFSEKVTYQAKLKEYEKEIDQIIDSCLD